MASVGEGVGVGWRNDNAEETLRVVVWIPYMTNTKKQVAIGLPSGLVAWVDRVLVCVCRLLSPYVCMYIVALAHTKEGIEQEW